MALSKTVKTVHGFDAVNAYHRVEGIVMKSKTEIEFHVRSSVNGVMPSFSDADYSCEYDLAGPNPIAQAYAYLKTLPEFAGATDC